MQIFLKGDLQKREIYFYFFGVTIVYFWVLTCDILHRRLFYKPDGSDIEQS